MFLLVEWTEENMFSVISYRAVETTRKEYSEYAEGEDVTARFNGKKYPARIVKKSGKSFCSTSNRHLSHIHL